MAGLAEAVIERFGEHYPHLLDRRPVIERVIGQEETRFSETLAAGTHLLTNELDRLARAGEQTLPGPTAFRLYNTYGFPLELTQEAAAARGVEVDLPGFEAALAADRERARRGAHFANAAAVDLPDVAVRFEGYERLAVPDRTPGSSTCARGTSGSPPPRLPPPGARGPASPRTRCGSSSIAPPSTPSGAVR
jgi:alanyl-tRNA synthetase